MVTGPIAAAQVAEKHALAEVVALVLGNVADGPGPGF
jgi:hypothetical protein